MIEDPPAGLVFRPLGVRVRQKAPGPDEAIATSIHGYDPIDLYFSELRDDYLAGRIKQVSNTYRADGRPIHASVSIVRATPPQWAERAIVHRERLVGQLRAQYKSAIVRTAADNPKNAKRLHERVNKALGTAAPDPADVEAWFADRPEAVAAAAGIRALLDRLDL